MSETSAVTSIFTKS